MRFVKTWIQAKEDDDDESDDSEESGTWRKSPSSAPIFSLRNFLITLLVSVILGITPLVQTLIELGACIDTPLGNMFLISPLIRCDSASFLRLRNITLAIGIPYLLLSLGYLGFCLIKPFAELKLLFRKSMKSLRMAQIFIALQLGTTLLVGLASSLGYWNDKITSSAVPVILLSSMCVILAMRPVLRSAINGAPVFLVYRFCCVSGHDKLP